MWRHVRAGRESELRELPSSINILVARRRQTFEYSRSWGLLWVWSRATYANIHKDPDVDSFPCVMDRVNNGLRHTKGQR